MGRQPHETVRLRLASTGYDVTGEGGSTEPPDVVVVADAPEGGSMKVFAPSLELRTMFDERTNLGQQVATDVRGFFK